MSAIGIGQVPDNLSLRIDDDRYRGGVGDQRLLVGRRRCTTSLVTPWPYRLATLRDGMDCSMLFFSSSST